MTKRAAQYLYDLRLMPLGGDIRALKRIGSIGAFVAAGAPLLVAARLAEAILTNFNQADGEAPSGIEGLAFNLPKEILASSPADPSDYWYHQALISHPELYKRGVALKSDQLVEIVDRRHVFMPHKSGPISTVTGAVVDAPFIGWVEGWERGTGARVSLWHEKILMDDTRNPSWRAEAARIENEAQAARENALGKLTVNISLAIRTALDRVSDHRMSKASAL